MVLAHILKFMKHVIFVVLFAIFFLTFSLGITALFSFWYGPRYIESEEDMNVIGKVFLLFIWPGFFIVGGVFGSWLYRHKLTR